jgi:BirA family biotin operon repressor/biotin-[acetyl-CoA-carboxylase] ligase
MIIGREIVRYDSVLSTMDVLAERAAGAAAEGLVVLADEQSAGRGRSGRTWVAPPGTSLLCSILLRPRVEPDCLGALSLMAGVAVANAIESLAPVRCSLKWPNDVLINNNKVAGILLQSRLNNSGVEFVNLGVGINVSTIDDALEPGATSLIASSGESISRELLLESLCQALDDQYASFISSGGRPSLAVWRERAAMIGERISIVRDYDALEGTLLGIDELGRLRLELDSTRVVLVDHGDVRRGPREAQL